MEWTLPACVFILLFLPNNFVKCFLVLFYILLILFVIILVFVETCSSLPCVH